MRHEEWQWGKHYTVAQDGDLMVRREYGVTLGEVRVFQHTHKTFYGDNIKYFAERKFRSIIPFRAPVVWWRKINAE